METLILDVREADEFAAEHIPGSHNLPLSRFSGAEAAALCSASTSSRTLLMCGSGKRAQIAHAEILKFDSPEGIAVFAGGIAEWKRLGNPVATHRRAGLPIMRQVQLIAGLLVLGASLLTVFVNANFVWLAAFVGAGLTLAGSTGFCGMALVLARAPWNR